MPLTVTNTFTSAGCNTTPLCSAWGRNNLFAYAVSRSIFICDPTYLGCGRVLQTLIGHDEDITCLRWVPKNSENTEHETQLISSSTDKTARIWSKDPVENKWCLSHTITTNWNVENVDALPIFNSPDNDLLVATLGDYGTSFTIWIVKQDESHIVKTFSLHDSGSIVRIIQPSFSDLPPLLLGPISNKTYGLFIWQSDNFIQLNVKLAHSNFVNGIDYIHTDNGETLIATTAHDYITRLWRIKVYNELETEKNYFKAPEQIFEYNDKKFKLELESLLKGHENWIHGIHFNPQAKGKELVTASHDRYLFIFRQTAQGIWTIISRFGDFGGYFIGFNGAGYSPDGNILYSYTYTGAFHVWKRENIFEDWEPHVFAWGGHLNEIGDAVWESKGRYVFTTGKDKTTRVFSPGIQSQIPWHEIARPQVHGYELTNIVSIGNHQFCSASAEKLVRLFQAPKMFFDSWRDIYNEDIQNQEETTLHDLPLSADFQALELSNKPIFKAMGDSEVIVKREVLKKPPTDNYLHKSRWPEVHKFYGHGYDVSTLAELPILNKNGICKLIATSCRTEHKTISTPIILWDTNDFREISKIDSDHHLTITQLAFSPNGHFLLSVSRDRKWIIYGNESNDNETELWSKVEMMPQGSNVHKRAIWSCAWTPDSKYFATGSRDGRIAIWSVDETVVDDQRIVKCEQKSLLELKDSVTTLDFSRYNLLIEEDQYLLAVGFESGKIHLYSWKSSKDSSEQWELIKLLDNSMAHHLCVKKVMFRPILGRAELQEQDEILQLLSCSSDSILRIYDISYND